MGKPTGLVQGTLDLLILRTIEQEPKHGWAIAKRIQQISNNVLKVQQGSLYPALYRLEKQGWIAGRWAATDTGREAKLYRHPGRPGAPAARGHVLDAVVRRHRPRPSGSVIGRSTTATAASRTGASPGR